MKEISHAATIVGAGASAPRRDGAVRRRRWLSRLRLAGRLGAVAAGLVLLTVPLRLLAADGGTVAVSRTNAEHKAFVATNGFVLPDPAVIDSKDLLAPGFSRKTPGSVAELRAMERHIEALIKRVSPATVAVEVGSATGSGVVVSSDGLVLTAAHVSGPRARNVTFRFPDGKTARGKTLERDEDSDVSFLRITDAGPWPFLPMGELESAKPGHWVIALGHPGGFDAKRSLVVRSGRIIRIRDLVQTDCTISPGDSGGPLVDMHGRVIGIHTTIGGMTENYHVPITGFYDIWRQVAAPEERRASAPDKGQTSDASEAAH